MWECWACNVFLWVAHLVVQQSELGAFMRDNIGHLGPGAVDRPGIELGGGARIIYGGGRREVGAVRGLMREYAAGLGVDLCYQNFEEELRTLPGKYRRPQGTLLLALAGADEIAGCIAIRPLEMKFCEMKRLYVRPKWRSLGLAKKLIAAALDDARRAGHRYVRLDTLPTMIAARCLYAALGFRPIAPYYQTPVTGTAFLQLDLQNSSH